MSHTDWSHPEKLLLPYNMNMQSSLTNKKVLSPLAQVTDIFTYLGQNWACGKCKYPSHWWAENRTENTDWVSSCSYCDRLWQQNTPRDDQFIPVHWQHNWGLQLFLLGGEGGGEKGAFKHIKLCSDKLLFASLLQMEELRIFSCICGSSFGSVQLYLSVIKQIQPPCAVEVFPQCKQQREKGKELLLDF